MKDINEVFERLRNANLRLKLSKCHFAKTSVKYLGHIISKHGIKPNPEKVSAVSDYPIPKTIKQLRAFLGMASYYRSFQKGFSHIATPLFEMTKKNVKFKWSSVCQEAFDTIKHNLTTAPILAYPDFEKQFYLYCDASDDALGYVLSQNGDDGREHPIAYGGTSLNDTQKRYSTNERETMAVVYGIKKFQPYLYGQTFTVVTDHSALKYLMATKEPVSRTARWIAYLQQFDFTILHRSGKTHQNADALSRREYPPVTIASLKLDDSASPYQIINSTINRVRKLQRQDKHLMPLIKFITTDELPPNNALAKRTLMQCEEYYVDDNGILFHLLQAHKSPTGNLIEQLVIPETLKIEVLTSMHDHPTGGHMGMDRTYNTIKLRYFWQKMFSDVKHWIKSCTSCNLYKNPKNATKAELNPIAVEPYPFHRVSIDITGPFHTTTKQNRFIVVMTDHLTKYPEAVAVPDITAPTVARVIYDELICRHGCPSILQSDRGTNFLSIVVRELCKIMKISKVHSSSFHAMSQGLVERYNGTIIKSLSMYTSKYQTDWDSYIPSVLMAYRVSPATNSTLHTPFMLLRGRQAILPIDLTLLIPNEAFKNASEHLKDILPKLETFHSVAMENIKKAQQKMKKYYDKNAQSSTFDVGDYVWVYTPNLKKNLSKKLLHQWQGPMYLTKKVSPVTFILRNNNNKLLKAPVHVNRMKQYVDRNSRPIGILNDVEGTDIDDEDIPDDSFDTTQDNNSSQNINSQNNDPEIAKVLHVRRRNRANQFLIHWVGKTTAENTWEYEHNIKNKTKLVEFMKNKVPTQKQKA